MLNVLYVLYEDFTANSATHVAGLAAALAKRGCDCVVAVPRNKATVTNLGAYDFAEKEFDEVVSLGITFADGRGPDIVHAWTPREVVRRFCDELRARYEFRQVVHLEDNEDYLRGTLLGGNRRRGSDGRAVDPPETAVPLSISHPVRAREFVAEADGVTVIIESLRKFVPADVPSVVLRIGVDLERFDHRIRNADLRRKLGIDPGTRVLVYGGNVHAANAAEVRSLYIAVALLNRRGTPTVLVRAGRDFCPFLGPDDGWARRHSIELGYLPHTMVPSILAMADLFVQPGRPGEFNDFRLPSKVPEFLAMGRPTILPAANVGLQMEHREEAFVLTRADGLAIAEAVQTIADDPDLYQRLSAGARRYACEHLDWRRTALEIGAFYSRVAASPPRRAAEGANGSLPETGMGRRKALVGCTSDKRDLLPQ